MSILIPTIGYRRAYTRRNSSRHPQRPRIPQRTTKEDRVFAKDHGLIIVYGSSADLCEFEGAWTDELGSFDGDEFVFKNGEFVSYSSVAPNRRCIERLWCPDGSDRSWVFKAHNIPNVQRFTIMADGKPFSDGLVFRLDDCKPMHCEACGQKLLQS
jgi:hypothetical protein